jgi:flavin reductase (DIM6/NTAB) family NADH-FMN oxidoreductase RutF
MSAEAVAAREPDAIEPAVLTSADQSLDPVTVDDFKQIFRRHPAGVSVITLRTGDGRPVGFTATSVISVAAAPPTVAFSLAATSRSWPAVARSESLVINFLTSGQAEASLRFAATDVDRFAPGDWSELETGEPVLDGCHSWLRGRVARRIPVGPSFLIVVDVLQTLVKDAQAPLIYHDRAHHTIVAPGVEGLSDHEAGGPAPTGPTPSRRSAGQPRRRCRWSRCRATRDRVRGPTGSAGWWPNRCWPTQADPRRSVRSRSAASPAICSTPVRSGRRSCPRR